MELEKFSGKEIDELIEKMIDICLTKSLMDKRFSYLVYDLREIKRYRRLKDKKRMLKKFLEQNKFLCKELNINGGNGG